jgi:glucosyl-dolichyl phosphate glucuronosyltransferase
MKATIIIPTAGNRIDYLCDTLVAVQNQTFPDQDYEIIVVDNSKAGNLIQIVDRINQSGNHIVSCIREENPGLHNARHAGAREATGDILVYIDDDIILPSNWLEAILSPFQDLTVGCSGGKVLPQWEAEVPPWLSQFHTAYLSLLDYGEKQKSLTDPAIWGCNMAVRKKTFFEVGGSNVDFFADQSLLWFSGDGECGLEDKILNAGQKIIYEPQAFVYHRIPASRLTPEYFYNRFIFTGIHESYTRVRKWNKRRFFFLKLISFAILDLFESALKFGYSLINKLRRIKSRADSYRLYSRARHATLLFFSKKFRDHVLKESYL